MDTLNNLVFPVLGFWLLRAFALFFGLSLIAVLIGLGVHKSLVLRRARQSALWTEHARQTLLSIANGDALRLEPVSDFNRTFCVVDAFRDCKITDHDQERRLHDAMARAGIDEVLHRAMQSQDWGLRSKCMSAIHELRWPRFFDALIERSGQEDNMRVHSSCLYACASVLRSPEQFFRLYDATDARNTLTASFAESVFRTAIRRLTEFCPPEAVHSTMEMCLSRLQSPSLTALIMSIGKEHIRELAPSIVKCARAQPKRIVVVSAMRALHLMQLYDHLILEGLSSEDTIIQITAIRTSVFCGDAVWQKLARLMNSRSFDVRYAAAMTLRAIGARGIAVLREVLEENTDLYAKNMAAFALAME